MKNLSRATSAGLLFSVVLAGCGGGGSGYSGPPGIINPGATATPTVAASIAATPTAASTTAATPTAASTTAATPTATPTTMSSAPATATPAAGATTPAAATPTASATAVSSTGPVVTPTPVVTATATPMTASTPTATPAPTPSATSSGTATMSMVCPPNPIPTPVTTTEPFPTKGGTVPSPDYYDSTGSTTYPANNAPSGTMTTTKLGGTNYDNFPSPSMGGTVISYIESSNTAAAAITFTGTNPVVLISATSQSCFLPGKTYYIDVDTAGGATIISQVATPSPDGHTQTFPLTSTTHQQPSGTLQLLIVQE